MQIKSVQSLAPRSVVERTPTATKLSTPLPTSPSLGLKIISVTSGSVKRHVNEPNDCGGGVDQVEPQRKRIKPTFVSKLSAKSNPEFNDDPLMINIMQDNLLDDSVISDHTSITSIPQDNGGVMEVQDRPSSSVSNEQTSNHPKTPLSENFNALLKACREADSTATMQKLIDKRLIKYYQGAHPEFVNSPAFNETVSAATGQIKDNPKMVYYHLKGIVEELDMRRKNYSAVIENDQVEAPVTGDQKTDIKLRKLTLALTKCKKKIKELEEAEVDFDDEHNSNYILAERFKERAVKIYEKICDLTGENKNANRAVYRSIKFRETNFKEFNHAVQDWCNRVRQFPDFKDIYKIMDHCSSQFQYGLTKEQQKQVAQEAFLALGKSLSLRRRIDLYETTEYFSKDGLRDPAADDPSLLAKLEANRQRYQKKMDEVINT